MAPLAARASRSVTSALVALAVILTPSAASAQKGAAPDASSIPDSAFDRRSRDELRRIVDAARADALPAAPLVSRALQGAARRVPGPRVVALLRAHADSMRAARYALGSQATGDELDAGATALRAGASRAALRRVRVARPAGEATTALVVLTDLLSRGIEAGEAADALTSLAGRAPDSTLLSLQAAVARERLTDSPARLREIVERFSRRLPPGPPPPPLPDESGRSPFGAPSAERRSLALASLAGGGDAVPRGVFGEARIPVALTPAWHLLPTATMRFTDEGKRWGASLAVARDLRLASSVGARLFLSGELRSPVATSRDDLPIDPRLDAQRLPSGRSPELSFRLGSELRRRLGSSLVVGSLAVGQDRYSRLGTALVRVTGESPVDTQTPRPDTLRPVTREELRPVWRALGTTSLRGTVALRRRGWMLEGGFTQRLAARVLTDDSLARTPTSLFTLGAERRVAPWASVVAQWATRDPSRVLGAPALADSRLRVGIRLVDEPRAAPTRPPRSSRPRASSGGAPGAITSVAVVAVSRADSALVVRVQVASPGASFVEVEGDLTAWTPRRLLGGADGTFTGDFTIAGGVVRLRVRVDGGAWTIPPGAPTQRDDFGDEVAVYVVRSEGP